MTAKYEADLHVPVASPIVMETAKESCRESYLKSGRPDLYKEDMVHYVTDDQFAYAAGVNGIMLREKPAAVFYQGRFYAESLILAETGNSIDAIQMCKEHGFKVEIHIMLDLPGSSTRKDMKMLEEVFQNENINPDYIKLYRCSVTPWTSIEKWFHSGKYKPYANREVPP